jgi:cytochrome c oxidase assembly protein subunit 11
MNFPVVFFVDPSIADDKDLQTLDTITLSYTFYPVEKPAAQSLNATPAGTATN